jgi:hypothetical protein
MATQIDIVYKCRMDIYRINPVGGGIGFKVDVADETGGLRVVGVFSSEADAQAWIATDRQQTDMAGRTRQLEPVSQT